VKLIRKNDKLIGENQSLKRELGLHKQTQEEFAKKVHVYQKTIKTLLAKLNALDANQQQELQKLRFDDEEKEREKAENQQRIESLDEESVTLRAQLTTTHDDAEHQQAMYHELEEKHMQMLSLQDESVKFTLQCLKDMREEFEGDAAAEQPDGGGAGEMAGQVEQLSLQALDPTKREQVMQYLLDQLQAYQQQLRELELHRQWQQHTAAQERNRLPPIAGAVAPSEQLMFGQGGMQADLGPGGYPSGPDAPGMLGGAGYGEHAMMSVNGPVRPWGKRSKKLPLTRHTPSSFQRAGQGHGGTTLGYPP